ncbi:16S rRNA (uracil(1498)-N(3))-methyltransferase [Leptolyngbya sp. 15MV]|nr:16S rRNA (uracil(1498)-N(3))-methyltransferase [Leptolyngbya sp. 15MV]
MFQPFPQRFSLARRTPLPCRQRGREQRQGGGECADEAWPVTRRGATRIIPVLTRRSVVDRANVARLTLIARGAAEQCERLSVPDLAEAQPLHRVLDGWDGTPLVLAQERGAASALRDAVAKLSSPLALLVGPEGGFETAELDDLRRRAFVVPAALGPRILRAETAAVAGLAAVQALVGDWAERA